MIEKSNIRRLMVKCEKARKNILHPYFSQIGLTFGQGQARVLETLLVRDHISQKELADLCHIDVTTISRAIDRLEDTGYLVRERDPGCRRSFSICLTDHGREAAFKVQQVLSFVDDRIWEGFSPEEMEQLSEMLQRICKNLEVSAFKPQPPQ